VSAEFSTSFFEEVAGPVGPTALLGSWAEVGFELHPNLQIFESGGPDDAGNLDSLRHFDNSDGVWRHVLELWR